MPTLDIDGVRVKDLSLQQPGTLYRGQQLTVFGHYWNGGDADIEISGTIGGQKKTYRTRVSFPQLSDRHPELERLWAYGAIEHLQDKIDYLGKDADSKQAIVDIALEYSLVTDYTSMLVMREEAFAERGISRKNRDRVAREQAARQQRAQVPVRNNRADTNKPLYQNNRPSMGGGGGAWGLEMFLLLPALLLGWSRRKVKADRSH